MSLETLFVYCPTCARENLAEAPPCPDGHGEICPDLACVECGTALTEAPILVAASALHRSRRAA